MLAACKNATPASVRADKGYTGRSLFGLALLHAPFLTKYLCSKGGGCRAVGWVTCPKQKALRIRLACPQAMWRKRRRGMKLSEQATAKALASHGDLL